MTQKTRDHIANCSDIAIESLEELDVKESSDQEKLNALVDFSLAALASLSALAKSADRIADALENRNAADGC